MPDKTFSPPDKLAFVLRPNSYQGVSEDVVERYRERVAVVSMNGEEVERCLQEIALHRENGKMVPPWIHDVDRVRKSAFYIEYPDTRLHVVRLKGLDWSELTNASISLYGDGEARQSPAPERAVMLALAWSGKGRAIVPEAMPDLLVEEESMRTWRRPLSNINSMLWVSEPPECPGADLSWGSLALHELERAWALLSPAERERDVFRSLAAGAPEVALAWLTGSLRWPGTRETRTAPRGVTREDCAPLLSCADSETRLRAIAHMGSLPGAELLFAPPAVNLGRATSR